MRMTTFLLMAACSYGCPADGAADGESGTSYFLHRGYCFEHTQVCTDDAQCDTSIYDGCDSRWQRCRAYRFCACLTDPDCAEGYVCLTNERWCGVCELEKAVCTSADDCGGNEECWRSRCQERCCLDCDCPTQKIAFDKVGGCQTDGVEFCVPQDNRGLVEWIQTIAPAVTCGPGTGRAGCDPATQLLCVYPMGSDECASPQAALNDHAWGEICQIASMPAVARIVPRGL